VSDYNGWRNYETWSVALIIDNAETLQLQAIDTARAARAAAPADANVADGIWTVEETERFRLADMLREWVDTLAEVEVGVRESYPWSFLWAQLVRAALDDVDWSEVADHYLTTLGEVAS
jgi:hypothetical protein